MVKEDSFGLFGGLGRGSWQERKEGAGRGSEDGAGAGGGRGIASLSERNNVERAKEGDSHRERVRVFGQQPPGVWSLSNTRDIRGLGFLWIWGGVRVFGFSGVCFVWGFGYCGGGFGLALIWMVKILLLYLYNDLKQLDYGCK